MDIDWHSKYRYSEEQRISIEQKLQKMEIEFSDWKRASDNIINSYRQAMELADKYYNRKEVESEINNLNQEIALLKTIVESFVDVPWSAGISEISTTQAMSNYLDWKRRREEDSQ